MSSKTSSVVSDSRNQEHLTIGERLAQGSQGILKVWVQGW